MIEILRQETGIFGRRHLIGPATWPHFDLLWIHEGNVRIEIGDNLDLLNISAPGGVLIFPNTRFQGSARGGSAQASICHFETDRFTPGDYAVQYFRPAEAMNFHVHNLLRLSLYYAKADASEAERVALLDCILDAIERPQETSSVSGRVQFAWSAAEARLSTVRSLADVAAFVNLSESSFRALHRSSFDTSAGRHLRELRLKRGERLLVTTGESVSEISKQVGYANPESFSHSFKLKYGQSPLEFRKMARNFA